MAERPMLCARRCSRENHGAALWLMRRARPRSASSYSANHELVSVPARRTKRAGGRSDEHSGSVATAFSASDPHLRAVVLARSVARARFQFRSDAAGGRRPARPELVAAQFASRLFLQQSIRTAGTVL